MQLLDGDLINSSCGFMSHLIYVRFNNLFDRFELQHSVVWLYNANKYINSFYIEQNSGDLVK